MAKPSFWRSGHLPTLIAAFLYFDLTFAAWVLNAAMAPFISADLHLSDGEKGLMLAIPVLAGAFLRLPLALAAQVIGRKPAAIANLLLVAVALAIGWLWVDTYAGVLVMGGLLGVAGGSFGVALALGAGAYPDEHKGLAMGIAGAGNSGAVLAMIFAPPLARAVGWQSVYGLAIVPMLLCALVLALFAREPSDRTRAPWSAYLKVLIDRDAWILTLVYMVTFGGYIGLTSFLPTLFHDQYGIAKESVGAYAAGIVIAASVLRVAGGWLADRFGGTRLLCGLLLVIGASIVAAAVLPARPAAMVVIMLIAFSAMGAGNGAVFQLVPLRFRGNTAVASGLIGEIAGIAGGLLPAVMGFGKGWTGSYAPGFVMLLVLAVAAFAMLAITSGQWVRRALAVSAVLLVAATASADPYVPPWQLRPAAVATSLRLDTAWDQDTAVGFVSGSWKLAPRWAPFARVATVADESAVVTNPAIGVTFSPHPHVTVIAATTIPIGMHGDAEKAGLWTRSAMDNAIFAVDDLGVIAGVDAATVRGRLTLQAEVTGFQLLRVRGTGDAAKTNLTSGVAAGLAVTPWLGGAVELRYQRYLSTPMAVAADPTLRESVSAAIGVRGKLALGGGVIARPGLAVVRGLDRPLRGTTIVLADLPILF